MNRSMPLALTVAVALLWGCNEHDPVSPAASPPTAPPSENRAVSTPIQGTLIVTGVIDPGDEFVTPGGTRHIKGQVLSVALLGDLPGTATFVMNINGNDELGNGGVSGPFTADVVWQGKSGSFRGQFGGHLHEFLLRGTFVGKGEGELDGLMWKATAEGPFNGPILYEGSILAPRGG